jgi:hypothetical protein
MEVFDLTISPSMWAKDKKATGNYLYYADVAHDSASLNHRPDVTLHKDSLDAAYTCGMAPTVEIFEAGKLRFYAMDAPTAEISGTCELRLKK